MSIMAIYRSESVDQAKYDAVVSELQSDEPPAGAIVHLAGFTAPSSIVVVEAWETRDQLETFRQRLEPVLRKHGIPVDPPELIELHAVQTVPTEAPALAPA